MKECKFDEKMYKKFGDKFKRLTPYINQETPISFLCPIHGEFERNPHSFLRGSGCKECGKENSKIGLENAVKKAAQLKKEKAANEFDGKMQAKFGDKFKRLTEYVDECTDIDFECSTHGKFTKKSNVFLSSKYGCPHCGMEKCKESALIGGKIAGELINKKAAEEFDEKSNNRFNGRYRRLTPYVDTYTEIYFECPIHGVFKQSPINHLQSVCGCQECGNEKKKQSLLKPQDECIEEFRAIHGKEYDYSKFVYYGYNKESEIICNKHGSFYLTPSKHLRGQGCPYCHSSKMETEIRTLLNEHNIEFDEQKRFKWLGLQSLDFYIPKYKIAIECQGLQHFENVDYFGGKKGLNECARRDKNKLKLCTENNIKLLYYANYQYKFPYNVITDKQGLINQIYEIK